MLLVGTEEQQIVVRDPDPVVEIVAARPRLDDGLEAVAVADRGEGLGLFPERAGVQRQPHAVDHALVDAHERDAQVEHVVAERGLDGADALLVRLDAGQSGVVLRRIQHLVVAEIVLDPALAPVVLVALHGLAEPALHRRVRQVEHARVRAGIEQTLDHVGRRIEQPVRMLGRERRIRRHAECRDPQPRLQTVVRDLLREGRDPRRELAVRLPVAVGDLVAVVHLEVVDPVRLELARHHREVLAHDFLVDVGPETAGGAGSRPAVPAVRRGAAAGALRPHREVEPGRNRVGIVLEARPGVRRGRIHVHDLAGQRLARRYRLAFVEQWLIRHELVLPRALAVLRGRVVVERRPEGGESALHAQRAGDPGASAVEIDQRMVPVREHVAARGDLEERVDDGLARALVRVV